MKYFAWVLMSLLFGTTISTAKEVNPPPPDTVNFFSFENDLEGWQANATDVQIGDGAIFWSVTGTQEMANDGTTSVKLEMDNRNDQGKVWIQRPFVLEPKQTYKVKVKYFLASADSDITGFVLLTTVLQYPPVTRVDLLPAYQDSTSNGKNPPPGYQWNKYSYDFTEQTDDQGVLYVVIGVWGVYEVYHKYYLDSVQVTLTKASDDEVPHIDSVSYDGNKKITIQGQRFGPSPRVLINGQDVTDFIRTGRDSVIKLKGRPANLRLSQVENTIRVIDGTSTVSNVFILKL